MFSKSAKSDLLMGPTGVTKTGAIFVFDIYGYKVVLACRIIEFDVSANRMESRQRGTSQGFQKA
jgi:hypothetical protein